MWIVNFPCKFRKLPDLEITYGGMQCGSSLHKLGSADTVLAKEIKLFSYWLPSYDIAPHQHIPRVQNCTCVCTQPWNCTALLCICDQYSRSRTLCAHLEAYNGYADGHQYQLVLRVVLLLCSCSKKSERPWQKRWVTFNGTELKYFRNKGDKVQCLLLRGVIITFMSGSCTIVPSNTQLSWLYP